MSKCNIRPEFECQNRISNVKMRYRPEFECQNRISNVKIRYLAKRDIWPKFECQNRISNVKMSRPEFEVKMKYSGPLLLSK